MRNHNYPKAPPRPSEQGEVKNEQLSDETQRHLAQLKVEIDNLNARVDDLEYSQQHRVAPLYVVAIAAAIVLVGIWTLLNG